MPDQGTRVNLSVVIPVFNERDNVMPLAREIAAALQGIQSYEVLFVDDASTDGTADAVRAARRQFPQLRLLRHSSRCGQSLALRTGIANARAEWVATLDGDGQNDPADLPVLLAARDQARAANPRVLLLVGHRVSRRDSWLRRVSSRIANGIRSRMLGDETPDTGCGLKLIHRESFLSLPAFDHMHRFLPALFRRAGAEVRSVPVRHRPRTQGTSKYGVHNRLWVGIVDLVGVGWLISRRWPSIRVDEDQAEP
jgi:dolichol-phosphate mannosyltransferase